MSRWPPHLYRTEAIKRGLSLPTIEAVIERTERAAQRQIPPILTLAHLGAETQASYQFLRDIVTRRVDPYRTFRLRKRSGGWRTICIPDPSLLRVQRWLNDHVLQKLASHPAAMAYKRGCTPLACASVHSGARWLVKVDVRQFFESISEIQAYRVFRGADYGSLISFEMARLVTRLSTSRARLEAPPWKARHPFRYRVSEYQSPRIGHLPQGAPTSPMLANLAMVQCDRILEEYTRCYGVTYTRYSDDLIFSSGEPFERKNATSLIRRVYEILGSHGLSPQTSKTIVAPSGSRRVVLGLLVDQASPRLTREFRSRLENHVFHLCTKGPVRHAEKRGFVSVKGMRRHIEGLLAYAMSVDPEFARRQQDRLASVEWPL